MSKFVHLHTHSHYSFLQALPKVPELVKAAKAAGMPALGITDAGNLHAGIEFYKQAEKAGVKAILGVDAYLAPRSRFDKEQNDSAGKRARLVLLAKDNVGYKNLLALITKSFTEGFLERPRMDKKLLREHAEGLIAILPSFAGEVAQQLKAGDRNGASAALAEYVSIFGKENVYLELTHHPKVDGHEKRMKQIREIAEAATVKVVAQHDVYYLKPEDREATEVMRRIQHGGERSANEEEDFSFVTEKQMLAWFTDIPEAVYESGAIAERCNVTLNLGSWNFPAVPREPGKTYEETLREKTYAGIKERNLEETDEVKERIEYELGVIIGKGFAPYFLAVSDLLQHAKEKGILTTTRGSAAGSLVSYLNGITNVDPLFYKLPFERFLNPERPKAPDIDMDFADNRRDEMIAYAKEKYGEDHVAQIGTFGTLMARAAVRDVSRALGHAYRTGDQIAKLIPLGSQGFPMTIEHALELEPELKSLYEEDDDVRQIIDLARRIEGCVRHTGVHAAGVVIAPTPLSEWTPLQVDQKTGKLITQYDMHAVEDAGLLKFDFLGIKNLAILADAITRVRESKGIEVDIENIPLDDTTTFAMLARGETEGTFQLNGSGMTRYLKELRPNTIHDINAMVALYRPGPMETIPQYIERKANPKLIRYIDDRMAEYLDASYGLLVYQDDVLLTAITLGGYTWLEADTLRKAMGKKIPEEMEAQKEKLTRGFQEFGKISKEKSNQLWKLIEPFAAYGFNKAHAACYGKVAYQTAYMKANFPVEYMAAVLTADAGDTDSISVFVAECERMKIPVLPPDINESGSDFTVAGDAGDTIRFGLTSIKNFGEGSAESLIEERKAHSPYTSLSDFLSRQKGRSVNRKSLESLIKAGALDRFGERTHLLVHIEQLLAFHRDATVEAPQDSLFGAGHFAQPELTLPENKTPTSLSDKLAWEKELLGIYVSGHPLDSHHATSEKALVTIAGMKADPKPGLPFIIPVLVRDVRTILTKSGEKMAFINFEDKSTSIEGVMFPKLFKEKGSLVAPGACVLIKATSSVRNGELTLALENVKAL
ncbi:MAG: DNA polymerase III subunit alpha [Patescibacteria group bacterium]